MKKLMIAALLLGAAACSKDEIATYSAGDMVNFADSLTQTHTFGYDAPTVTKATVMVQVNVIGRVSDRDRTVELVQVHQPDALNEAVAGTHYAFDQKDKWFIPAGATTALLPITLMRVSSIADDVWSLRLAVANSADFEVGDAVKQQKTISFSGKLLQPAFWPSTIYTLGQWSARKQLFMFEVSGEVIDQDWYTNRYSLPNAPTHYSAMFRNALLDFNMDPANIASGAAPMKDESTGAAVSF